MSQINFGTREITCRIVYYGPGMGGKTTNLKKIYERMPQHLRGEMTSLATEDERTLFFDFMPLELGSVQGFQTRFSLYTVPGQTFYNAARKLILKGVDGVVFVADSSRSRLRANAESMRNLRENLAAHAVDIADVPIVLQANKRDLDDALPLDMLRAVIDPRRQYTMYEAIASSGEGVFDTLKAASRLVLERLSESEQGFS